MDLILKIAATLSGLAAFYFDWVENSRERAAYHLAWCAIFIALLAW